VRRKIKCKDTLKKNLSRQYKISETLQIMKEMIIIKVCEVCGRTDENYDIVHYKGMLLCRKHISQFSRHGKFLDKTIYDDNQYIIHNDNAEIILCDKHGNKIGSALIDIEDIDKCKKYKWHIKNSLHTQYAISTINENKKIFLHRLILHYNGKSDIDHINHNGLDNRKSNLRICSHNKNLTNQYNYNNGIYKTNSNKYRASICKNNKTIYIGTYDTEDEAIYYRKLKEKELFD